MEIKKTNRGFDYSEFTDAYGSKCSLQKSSSAMTDRIWFGVSEIKPRIMAHDAIKLGLDNKGETNGWVDFDVPKEVLFNDRMHLDQNMIHNLMPALTAFEDTGELTDEYYDDPFDWINKEYLKENEYELDDYEDILEKFESDIDRITTILNRLDERKTNLMKYVAHIHKAVLVLKELKEEAEIKDGQ